MRSSIKIFNNGRNVRINQAPSDKLIGKTIALGVSGSIAAYKSADLASELRKLGADVHVVMTKSAKKFISALTMGTISLGISFLILLG